MTTYIHTHLFLSLCIGNIAGLFTYDLHTLLVGKVRDTYEKDGFVVHDIGTRKMYHLIFYRYLLHLVSKMTELGHVEGI
jgi:hypothetical protein